MITEMKKAEVLAEKEFYFLLHNGKAGSPEYRAAYWTWMAARNARATQDAEKASEETIHAPQSPTWAIAEEK